MSNYAFVTRRHFRENTEWPNVPDKGGFDGALRSTPPANLTQSENRCILRRGGKKGRGKEGRRGNGEPTTRAATATANLT